MNDDIVERLLADELPNDGQWEKEARMVLHSLLKEAAGEIQQNRVDLEEYRRDSERFQKMEATLRAWKPVIIAAHEAALRACHASLNIAFDYDGDVFGRKHNDAVDACILASKTLEEKND